MSHGTQGPGSGTNGGVLESWSAGQPRPISRLEGNTSKDYFIFTFQFTKPYTLFCCVVFT